MNRHLLLLVLSILLAPALMAQDALTLTMRNVIDMATKQSPESKRANTVFDNNYWSYRTYLSNYRPQLTLSGDPVGLTRAINPVTQPDGTIAFQSQQQNTSSLSLSASQNVGLTGARIGLVSNLQRIDLFGDQSTTNYLAQPLQLSLFQPVFRFNQLKWDREIEPMVYEESQREYNENMESVAFQAVDLFFNLLIAQKSYEIAQKNLANNDTLFQIAGGRYNLGKIAENDLLQMELSVMNAQNSLSQAELDIQRANLNLAIFLGLTGTESITLVTPNLPPTFEVSADVALEKARINRKESIRFARLRKEAERDVARARGDNGFSSDIRASYGLNGNAELLGDAYQDPRETQQLSVSVTIPILDWGQSKARIRTAMANQELATLNIQQDEQNFEREVVLLVQRFSMSRKQLLVAMKSDTVAQKRYDISKKRYEVGKIDILDLNVALVEKDQAKQNYLQALQTYWSNFYDLRRRTLFDFERQRDIQYR